MFLFNEEPGLIRFRSVPREGGDSGAGTATGADTAAGASGSQSFTQEDVNRIVAEERRKLEEKNKGLVKQLEDLQKNTSLSSEQQAELSKQIEDLKKTYQTEAQLKEQELTRTKEKYETDLKKSLEERDSWRGRFEQRLRQVEIQSAANEHKAFNPTQIHAILAPLTSVVEKVGDDGKPSGEFTLQVEFPTKDKDGNDVTLKLSASEAVKQMTQQPEKYGNLFRTEATSGLFDKASQSGSGSLPDIEKMTPEQYKKHRTQILERTTNG